jgi:formylmethanofuran dehydrogenase subunit B
MVEAWIEGSPATLETAIEQAARLLQSSRMPVIAGLGTDVGGARAAIGLAQSIGAAIDHMHSAALLRDLDVMREAGMMVTTPNEARLRADLLLLVGPGLIDVWPEMPERLFVRPAAHGRRQPRRIVWLCPGGEGEDAGVSPEIEIIGRDPAMLPTLLAALRARCAGRPVRSTPIAASELEALARKLAEAKFGVTVWSAADHDGLTIEMLCGLVKDLNNTTRFSGLPLAPPDNAAAVQQVSGWLTAFPPRTGFGRRYPDHDPWRFDAARLVDSGEADCALWISSYGAVAPSWKRAIPLIALATRADALACRPDVAIAVGVPGIDHDAVEHLPDTATLAAVKARTATKAISVAECVSRIAAALALASC